MLRSRSILQVFCLILSIGKTLCQDYEGYGVDEQEAEESGPIDYTKYFNVDTSAPLVASQGEIAFTSPIENAGFFAPSMEFAASTNPVQPLALATNPFAKTKSLGFSASHQFPEFAASGSFPVDYFEEAQKAQSENKEEETPFVQNPDYISYHLPSNLDAEYSSGVEKKQKPYKKKNYDAERDASSEYDYSIPSGKYADYNTGKSSSTVSHYPEASGYYEKEHEEEEEEAETQTQTPYQKYSFQPVTDKVESKYLADLISTVAPFNPSYNKVASTLPPFQSQPSENVPQHLKGKNCRRVRKTIPNQRKKREAMNCYVCEEPEKNSKFTQCSYAEEAEPKNDYSGISERYQIPAKEEGFRYKRYSGDEEATDPYEYIKKRSQEAYAEATEHKDYDDYKVPDFYSSEGLDKSFSEIQGESIAKNPANCEKKVSDGMTCTVCKDPKSGGNFEQCSYTSEPKAQKYAYVTEKKYDSNDPEDEGTETKPVIQTKTQEIGSSIKKEDEPKSTSVPTIDKSKYFNKDFEKEYNLHKPTIPTVDATKYFKSDAKDYQPTAQPTENKEQYSKLEDLGDSPKENKANDPRTVYENFDPVKFYKASYHEDDLYHHDSKEDPSSKKEKYEAKSFKGEDKEPKKLVDDDPYDIPKHFAESTINEKKAKKGYEANYEGDSGEAESDEGNVEPEVEPYKDIDEYHFKLFPEFNHEESQQAQVITNPSAEATRKDVEEVLAEFSKKDRSACKKAEKNGMTCYLCVDEKGIQHEECMYVSESKPQASHLAYHEVKQMKSAEEPVPAGTEMSSQLLSKMIAAASPTLQTAASEEFETRVKYNPNARRKKSVRRVKKGKKPAEREDEYEEVVEETAEDPKIERTQVPEDVDFEEEPEKEASEQEFKEEPEEGAYSAETKPVYSKVLGVKLPKYMIEKTEFEKEFDDFSGIRY